MMITMWDSFLVYLKGKRERDRTEGLINFFFRSGKWILETFSISRGAVISAYGRTALDLVA